MFGFSSSPFRQAASAASSGSTLFSASASSAAPPLFGTEVSSASSLFGTSSSTTSSTGQSQSTGSTFSLDFPPALNKKAIYAGLKRRSKGYRSKSFGRKTSKGEEDEPELIPKPKLQAYLLQKYGKNASACSNPIADELGPMLYLPADQANNAQLEETDLTRTLNAAAFSILGVSEEINGRIQKLKGDVTQEKIAKLKAENQADLALKDFIGLQIDLEMARDNARAFETIEKERLQKLFEQEETIAKLSMENEQLKKDIKTAENLANTGMTNLLYELQQKIVIELNARYPKEDWSFIYSIVPDDEEEETKEQDVH